MGDDRYTVTTPGFSVFAVGATVTYDNAALSTASAAPGEQFTGSVDVTNNDDIKQTINLTLASADGTISTTEVTVPADTTTTATLSGAVTDPGTYELTINGNTAGTVQVTEQTTDAQTATQSPETTSGGSGPGFTAVATLLAVLSVIVGLQRRQTRP
jgi:PGF-CTERM protein